ncbi:C1 family peptidase [Helcococcus ovis]|uniref:Aminopeptidase n=2 Tax=Helcococcus ovis TaxID=72026 RepID=A0A4R9C6C3_9FIRM|nr:C1 family peptidase [Helcococcus ovis]TFF65321.1 aminopeptidase [Helcococcus ovis]TFF66500.1 aminopeptidase [Helcococcus ovis]TFF67722.1 aminopeptidase [Helcococcus ovis]WNZ01277.1 C1 family peptidase [Helcococcus ovis]
MKIDNKFLEDSNKSFTSDRAFRIAQRAATNTGLLESTIDRRENDTNRHEFNVNLTDTKIRYQKQSGRCWIFAAMNVLEYKLAQKFNLKEFEISQSYIYFFDKLERCNYFYESILNTLDEDLEGRLVSHILTAPMGDGGQWDMVKNIIRKYGVVPKNYMPESESSSSSSQMNNYLTKILRMNAKNLRKAHESGKSREELEKMIEGYMTDIYNALSISLGTPPTKVDFEARDKDDNFVSYKNITPKEFFELIEMDLDEYVSIINAPTKDKPYYNSYTVEFLGNVVEGDIVRYVNLPIEEMKKAILRQLQDKEPVWFGCDVGQFFSRGGSRLDLTTANVFDMFNVKYDFNKEERLDYHESLMTHAMVFMGCDYDEANDKINRYRVENTWGEQSGNKGFLVMSDEWFDEYMYQALINKKHLSKEVIEAYEKEPIKLKPWDPMGSLA